MNLKKVRTHVKLPGPILYQFGVHVTCWVQFLDSNPDLDHNPNPDEIPKPTNMSSKPRK